MIGLRHGLGSESCLVADQPGGVSGESLLQAFRKAVLRAEQPDGATLRKLLELLFPHPAHTFLLAREPRGGHITPSLARDRVLLRQHHRHFRRAEELGQGGRDFGLIQAAEKVELGIHLNAQWTGGQQHFELRLARLAMSTVCRTQLSWPSRVKAIGTGNR